MEIETMVEISNLCSVDLTKKKLNKQVREG